jgi:hypothetical protein
MTSKQLLSALALAGVTGAFATGCAARARAGGYVGDDYPVYYSEPPTLVYVDSNVWVVRDSAEPVYYVDDYYWAYRDDGWYRSRLPHEGWVNIGVTYVPVAIARRNHASYVHYQGGPNTPTRPAPRRQEWRPASLDQAPARVQPQRGGPPPHARPPHLRGPEQRVTPPPQAGPQVRGPQRAAPRARPGAQRGGPPPQAAPKAAPPQQQGEQRGRMAPASRDEAPRGAPPGASRVRPNDQPRADQPPREEHGERGQRGPARGRGSQERDKNEKKAKPQRR